MLAIFAARALFAGSQDTAPAQTPNNTQQQADAAEAEAQAEDERVICRREHVVGSNRPQRICMTRREWNAVRENSQDTMRQMERGSAQPLPVGM